MILRNLVQRQFTEERIGRAVVFFLLPTVLWVAFLAAFGLRINAQGIGLSVGIGLIGWLVIAGVLLGLVHLFKGRNVHAKFVSVLSAFSVNYLIAALAGLLSFLVVFLSIPGFFQKLASLQGKASALQDMVSVVNSLALPSDTLMAVVLVLLGIIFLAAALACVYVVYRIGSLAKETSRFSNLVFTVISLGLMIVVDYALSTIIGFFL